MTAYDELLLRLAHEPRTWLITGCAVFIGSNLLKTLLRANLLSACATGSQVGDQAYNNAFGTRTTLLEPFDLLKEGLANQGIHYEKRATHRELRPDDVRK